MDRDVKAMTDKWREWCAAYDGKVPLERIPNLLAAIAKDEREACAKVAERIGKEQYDVYTERDPEAVGDDIAEAIRKRPQ